MSAAVAIARSAAGGLAVTIGGVEALLRASGAMWLWQSRALVVADLHFEKGSAYATRGQMLPPYDTRDTLRRLEREVEALDPSVVVFLGDSFHDRGGEGRMAPRDGEMLAALARGRRLVWVVGNHDPEAPKALPGEVADEVRIEGMILRHEPAEGPQRGEAAGHLHPCARVAATGGSIRRRCFVTDGARVVLPAFGAYAGGLNVRDRAFAALFDRPPLAIVLAGDAQPIAWGRLVED
ncbi:MAG TPA: ligase-associated DNA damage response endonuclease PdeM [Caulobacteraceae bacterium]|nr:ligase-associated DNA damage response endonuclease PdeM [Caulobacteraceae bacterium]